MFFDQNNMFDQTNFLFTKKLLTGGLAYWLCLVQFLGQALGALAVNEPRQDHLPVMVLANQADLNLKADGSQILFPSLAFFCSPPRALLQPAMIMMVCNPRQNLPFPLVLKGNNVPVPMRD